MVSNILFFSPRSLGFHYPIWRLHIFQMGWFNHQPEDPCTWYGWMIHDLMTPQVPLSFFENLATVNSGSRRLDDLDLDWGPRFGESQGWSWELGIHLWRITAGTYSCRSSSDHFPFFSWVICRFQPLIFQGVVFLLQRWHHVLVLHAKWWDFKLSWGWEALLNMKRHYINVWTCFSTVKSASK